jgi:hypothetical protein
VQWPPRSRREKTTHSFEELVVLLQREIQIALVAVKIVKKKWSANANANANADLD